jgi:4-amino-4-deoxy-L-arabinose transferase-like glycosyltransferase
MSDRAIVRAVLLIVAGSGLVRLWLAGITGLGFDESYMLGNARTFMLSYVDQVPMHLWMAGLARRLFQSEAPVFVRLPFVLAFAGSTWLMFTLTRRLFSARAGLWAAIAFNLAPIFSLAHASWILADGPTVFFLLATANVVARILLDDPPPARPTLWWIVAGVLGGLALLSKYSAGFFFVAVFVFMLTVPGQRRRLLTPGPWLGVAAAFVVFLPALIWNAQHAFVGFGFQSRRVGLVAPHFEFLFEIVGGQLLYLSPWLAIPFLVSLFGALRRGPSDAKSWLPALAAIGPIAFFTLASLFGRGLPHWPMPGWIFAITLFGRDAAALADRRPTFARGYMAVAAVVFAILFTGFAAQATRGAIVSHAFFAEHGSADPTVDLVDWTDLRDTLAERGLLVSGQVFAAPIWMFAGKVSYALGPEVPVICVCDDQQNFPYRYDQRQWIGRDVIVVSPAGDERLWQVAGTYFDSFEPLAPVAITRGGETVLVLDLKVGKNLHFP